MLIWCVSKFQWSILGKKNCIVWRMCLTQHDNVSLALRRSCSRISCCLSKRKPLSSSPAINSSTWSHSKGVDGLVNESRVSSPRVSSPRVSSLVRGDPPVYPALTRTVCSPAGVLSPVFGRSGRHENRGPVIGTNESIRPCGHAMQRTTSIKTLDLGVQHVTRILDECRKHVLVVVLLIQA